MLRIVTLDSIAIKTGSVTFETPDSLQIRLRSRSAAMQQQPWSRTRISKPSRNRSPLYFDPLWADTTCIRRSTYANVGQFRHNLGESRLSCGAGSVQKVSIPLAWSNGEGVEST